MHWRGFLFSHHNVLPESGPYQQGMDCPYSFPGLKPSAFHLYLVPTGPLLISYGIGVMLWGMLSSPPLSDEKAMKSEWLSQIVDTPSWDCFRMVQNTSDMLKIPMAHSFSFPRLPFLSWDCIWTDCRKVTKCCKLSQDCSQLGNVTSSDIGMTDVGSWAIWVEAMNIDIHQFLAVINTITMPPKQCWMLETNPPNIAATTMVTC